MEIFLFRPNFAFHPVGMRSPIDRDVAGFAAPLEVLFDRMLARFERLRFAPNVIGGRSVSSPPMIKHARHMIDSLLLLAHAQKQIVILHAIVFRLETTRPFPAATGADR